MPAAQRAAFVEKLPAGDMVSFREKLPSGTISRKIRHAVPQLWAKRFLSHFFPRSHLVRAHSDDSLQLDSAVRGGTLGVTGAVFARNAELANDPEEQAAQLGGSGISLSDANAPPIGASVAMATNVEALGTAFCVASSASAPASLKREANTFIEVEVKRKRLELFRYAGDLMNNMGCLDPPMKEFLQRGVRNEAQLLLTQSAPETGGALVEASPTQDNGFWWSAVSRAAQLSHKFRCKSSAEEAKLGRAVSDACMKATGKRPAELNGGKRPQEARGGVALPTNVFTETQARAWADDAIRNFFNPQHATHDA